MAMKEGKKLKVSGKSQSWVQKRLKQRIQKDKEILESLD